MQIGRLFEMVYLLMNKKQLTAKALAGHFEVSKRTIYRDVEILSQAGIPIYATKGRYGGISLMDNFILNKSVLSEDEQSDILLALKSFQGLGLEESNQVLSKMSALFNKEDYHWIEIDFSEWNGRLESQFIEVKQAILERRIIEFDYYNADGEKGRRRVKPMFLWFKKNSWYLRAYCLSRQEQRTFKLGRMKKLAITEEVFNAGEILIDKSIKSAVVPVSKESNQEELKLYIDNKMAYRVYDEFDEDEISKTEAGFIVTRPYVVDEWVYSYILSYGHYASVIAPESIKIEIKERFRKSLENYS